MLDRAVLDRAGPGRAGPPAWQSISGAEDGRNQDLLEALPGKHVQRTKKRLAAAVPAGPPATAYYYAS
jgi:hypothetical protein